MFEVRVSGHRFSAELIVAVMRWQSSARAEGDLYAINSNAKPLLSRLYLLERPTAPLERRNSWLDHLAPSEWQQILDAWHDKP